MDDDDPAPCPAEAMASALARALLRKGLLDDGDMADAAAELDREGEDTAAHLLRCSVLEANATPESEWQAEKARGRFRVIEGGEK